MPVFDSELREVSEPVARDNPRARARVLVVDDEVLILRSVSRTLTHHDVLTVTEAREALRLLASGECFDVVLCDLMMPDLDGIAFHDAVQQTRPELLERLVFMTGGACSPETRAFMDTRRAEQHLEKPFSAEALRCRVIDILERRTPSTPPEL